MYSIYFSWNITGSNEKLVVMYSVPYNHDHYSNWIGVGLFPKSDQTKKFSEMYWGKEYNFKRKEFYYDVDPVMFQGSGFLAVGTCGTDHKPTIKVLKFELS